MSQKQIVQIDQLKSLIADNSIKLISFDIFDTLLIRPTILPADAFFLLQEVAKNILSDKIFNFYEIRRVAEDEARKKLSISNKYYGEITLTQIYEYIATTYKINPINKLKLMQAEIDLETQILRPRKIGKEIYELALQSGKKIIITSDIYHSKETLENILTKNGFDGYSQLYVSSEYKKRKDTGELYKTIIKNEKLLPHEILHIGDNMDTDVLSSLKCGIVAFYIPSNKDIFFNPENVHFKIWEDYKSLNPSERILLGICMNKIVDEMIANPENTSVFSDKYYLGYYGLGPLLFNMAAIMLSNNRIQNNYMKVYFASRDGFLPQKIYDLLRGGNNKYLESKYIYCGRQAYDVANFDGEVFEYLSGKVNHLENYTLANLLDALVEKDYLFNKYPKEWLDNAIYKNDANDGFKKLKMIINKYGDNIKDILEKHKSLVREYYKSSIELNNNNRAIIFDVGYSGSISKSISKITSGKIDKMYLWQTKTNEENDNKYGTSTLVFAGYQEQRINKPPIHIVLEELFSPLEQTCIGFDKLENNTFIPIFYKDQPFSEKMINDLNIIQNGAISFTIDTINLLKPYLALQDYNNCNTFLSVLKYSFTSPIDDGVKLMDNIVFMDHFSRNDAASLATKIEETNTNYFHRTPFLDNRLLTSTMIKEKNEKPMRIALHIHLYNIDQSFDIINYLMNAPNKFDLLISVCSEIAMEIVKKLFNNTTLSQLDRLIVKIVPNRGRDLAPWLVAFREEQDNYDLVCHIHSKKSQHFTFGKNWNDYLYENLISERSFGEIVKYFNNDPQLGVIFPPIYDKLQKFMVEHSIPPLGLNGELTICNHLLKKMKINKSLSKNNVIFSAGNMFWYRPKALKPLFEINFSYDDFPKEPIGVGGTLAHALERLHAIVAENQGYKTICYVNQDHLIKIFQENVLLKNTMHNDALSKLNSLNNLYDGIIEDYIVLQIKNKYYFEAFITIIKILSADPKHPKAKEKLDLLDKLIAKDVKENQWNHSKRDDILEEIKLLITERNYIEAENKLKIILDHEPTNINAVNIYSDLCIQDNNIEYAVVLNNLVLAISPSNEKALLVKKILQHKIIKSNKELLSNKSDKNILSQTIAPVYPKISIVIIAFNQSEYTQKCIESIRQYTQESYEIILIDNASSDNIENILTEKNNSINYYRNDANLGFPIAVNQGIKYSKGDYIVILNNDTIVSSNWLKRLLEVVETNTEIGMVGPVSNEVSGLQKDNDAKYNSIKEMQKYASKIKEKNKGEVLYFPRVAFLCTLIKKEVIDKIGGLDERFSPGNYEDDDYCLRAQLAGFKTVIVKDVFIHHYGSKSFKADGGDKYSKILEINKQKFIDKWGVTPDELWLQNKPIKPHQIVYPINNDLYTQYYERAKVNIADNEFPFALESLKKAIEIHKSNGKNENGVQYSDLLDLAGNVSLLCNELDSAKEYFEEELNANPNSSSACIGLGECFFQNDKMNEAKVMFEWGVKNNPENQIAITSLSKINKELGLNENHSSLN